jgi:hypothetical protein
MTWAVIIIGLLIQPGESPDQDQVEFSCHNFPDCIASQAGPPDGW